MARVQQVQEANKKKQSKDVKTNNQTKSKQELAKTNTKREPTKNEILFFRVGVAVIALTLITVAIIFTINHFMNRDEEAGVFDDFITINADELTNIIGHDENSGVYGDFTFFAGKDEYEDLYDLITQNNKIYIYFYSSSNLEDDIVHVIKDKNLEGVAFFLVDLDTESTKLGDAKYSHLELDLERKNLLVTFDVENQTFETEIRVTDIVRELGKI